MSLQGFYQIGYVTRDLDRALAAYGPAMGVEFASLDVTLPAQTPDGEKSIDVRVGIGWAGTTQIEIIQPVSGYIDAYVQALPDDPADHRPRLHHLAVRRDDLDAMRREVEDMRLPLVFETGGNGITAVFVDARETIGHYLELVHATPEGWRMVGWPGTA